MPRKKLLNAMSERKKRLERKHKRQQILNSPNSKQENNPIDTRNDQPIVVVKSEKFDSDPEISLVQVKGHINANDIHSTKRRKLEQAVYIKAEECESYPASQYIKSEEITEGVTPEVTDNFVIYEINEVNSSIAKEFDTESNKHAKSQASQRLQRPPRSENLKMVWTYSKTNSMQNTNYTTSNRLFPKIHNFLEIAGTSTSKQKASNVRKVASPNINGNPIGKVITSFSEETSKCACHLNPMKNVDIHSNLELKDFFEIMFDATCKLKIESRQTIKTELLKAISQAEEDVEAGKFCEKCYTMLAQPKKRY